MSRCDAVGTATVNHLFKISPAGVATVLETFDNVPRPNGIALTKDEKTLYVSFTKPVAGTKPFVRKYSVTAAGTLTDASKFAEFADDSNPDGMAVDDGGNVYVSFKTGVNVYKADGVRYGADPSIAIPGEPTGCAFGGADRKSLIVTTGTGKIYEVKVNIAGVTQ